jgi:hypothetical protein
LNRHDQAMARDELLGEGAAQVCPRPQRYNRGERLAIILVAEGAGVEGPLGAREILDCKGPLHGVGLHFTPGEPLGIIVDVVEIVLSDQHGAITPK